jgi:hypothetical protein
MSEGSCGLVLVAASRTDGLEILSMLREIGPGENGFGNSGHIGYCIRPAERGKGYGNHILRLTLAEGRSMGIERFLITCDEGNAPSSRVIEWNGGVLESMDAGACRYWIGQGEGGRDARESVSIGEGGLGGPGR